MPLETATASTCTRAAASYGYLKPDGAADVESWLQAITQEYADSVELYVRVAVWPTVALKKLAGGSVQVTDDDMQKGFESNYGERVEVLAIVMSDQRKAMEVWDMARNEPTDKFFGQLASQYSIEQVSQQNGGQVPPLRRHGGQPKLSRVLDDLLAQAQDLGGSMEYVHGAGLRLAHLMSREHAEGLEVLKRVKAALDPAGVLNPGKLGL